MGPDLTEDGTLFFGVFRVEDRAVPYPLLKSVRRTEQHCGRRRECFLDLQPHSCLRLFGQLCRDACFVQCLKGRDLADQPILADQNQPDQPSSILDYSYCQAC